MKKIKKLSIVKYTGDLKYNGYVYPFNHTDNYIFVGEIPNAKSHCIIMDMNGKLYPMYHTYDFRLATEEEV